MGVVNVMTLACRMGTATIIGVPKRVGSGCSKMSNKKAILDGIRAGNKHSTIILIFKKKLFASTEL